MIGVILVCMVLVLKLDLDFIANQKILKQDYVVVLSENKQVENE